MKLTHVDLRFIFSNIYWYRKVKARLILEWKSSKDKDVT
jgi:hypothetical protein